VIEANCEIAESGGEIRIHHRRNFPSGMVGLGLFLLRLITALAFGHSGYSLLYESAAGRGPSHLVGIVLSLLGALLIVGFVTTVAGIVACGLLLISLIWMDLPFTAASGTAVGLALVSALIGPGYYSLDAVVFGWRQVEITRRGYTNDN
jgi:uncharacterized membrane protein YphA (DoxX/SURF4 family)